MACGRGVVQARLRRFGARMRRVPRMRDRGLDFPGCPAHSFLMNMQTPFSAQASQVSFDRRELGVILSLYGRMVAAGEWRDYGISCLSQSAVFAVFRRTAETPLYRIEKHPALRNRQGQFMVLAMDGQILKRGHDLAQVLKVIERKYLRVVD